MRTIYMRDLLVKQYDDIWFWLYHNDIGDMKKQADDTGGYVDVVTMTDEEVTLMLMRWWG